MEEALTEYTKDVGDSQGWKKKDSQRINPSVHRFPEGF